MKITCFLPCRKGSERVKNKNIRPFVNFKHGLISIKLNQLLEVDAIDEIVLSTNDLDIIEYAQSLQSEKITIHKRDDSLSSSATSTDEVITLANDLIHEGHILWTHVTSPFLNSTEYSKIIEAYKSALEEGYDSLMTTTLIKGFIWDENGAVNYNREIEKWPRTQTITPLHEINSGVFLASKKIYNDKLDRIGDKPKLYPLDKMSGFDIDWPDDYTLAECLLRADLVEI